MNRTQINNWVNSGSSKTLFDKGTANSVKNLHLIRLVTGVVWKYKWKDIAGKYHYEHIGSFPALTLGAARKKAQEFTAKLMWY